MSDDTAARNLGHWIERCHWLETRAARVTNQLAVVRTLVSKYRKREMPAKAVIVAIEDMFRDNPEMHERQTCLTAQTWRPEK